MKLSKYTYHLLAVGLTFLLSINTAIAQPEIKTNIDARRITIGDQVRMFIEAKPDANERLIWANIPDTFNNLEVVEKGNIDTLTQDNITVYKQKLLVTGWDSGMYQIPSFTFTSVPKSGQPYKIATDSFDILVETVAVDTNKPFRPIAGIMMVETSWKDYIWYILGGLLAIGLIAFVIYYFVKNKNAPKPIFTKPVEKPDAKALRLLQELEAKQLWQNDKIKEYYTELTDILRVYIEERFKTPAMELTSDELLDVVRRHKEMMRYQEHLSMILSTADMAKFAKAKPLPAEHTEAFEQTKQFVIQTKPVETPNTDKQS